MGVITVKFGIKIENRRQMHKMLALSLKNAKRPTISNNRLQRGPVTKNNRFIQQPSQITLNNIPEQMHGIKA